jgi:radical SAM protein with 4Fe4S-binding SPASM domain
MIGIYLKYSTPSRIINFIKAKISKRPKEKINFYPYVYEIGIGNICNLKCPLCPVGTESELRKREFMTFDNYKKIIDDIAPYAFWVELYNWGEPFLNKDLIKMIEYAKEKNIGVGLSSNFNCITDEQIRGIIDKLDVLIISLDGVTQETYEKYRIGGKIDVVFDNITKLMQEKKSSKPEIIWQYLINRYNEKEISLAKELAEKKGIRIAFKDLKLGQEVRRSDKNNIDIENHKDMFTEEQIRDKRYIFNVKSPCNFLYSKMTINQDGTVSPCAAIYDQTLDFGNIVQDGLKKVWNNDKFRSARIKGETWTVCHVCETCK